MKRKPETELKREWGIDPKTQLRYRGLKGIYWYWFSIWRRVSDFKKWGGECISCSAILQDWRDGDCGHFIAAGHCGFALLFAPRNCNLQCKRCNNPSWSPDAGVFYATKLDERYGEGTAADLIVTYEDCQFKGKITKEWSQPEYETRIKKIKAAAELLLA